MKLIILTMLILISFNLVSSFENKNKNKIMTESLTATKVLTEVNAKAQAKAKVEAQAKVMTEIKTSVNAKAGSQSNTNNSAKTSTSAKSESKLTTSTSNKAATNLNAKVTSGSDRSATDFFTDLFMNNNQDSNPTGSVAGASTTAGSDQNNGVNANNVNGAAPSAQPSSGSGNPTTTPNPTPEAAADNSNADSANAIPGLMTDWLMISSKSFTNVFKFPPVTLSNGVKAKIKTDSLYFRINSSYNPQTQSATPAAPDAGGPESNLPSGPKYFWFRLSGSNLYYSSTDSDINILGAVAVRAINSVRHLQVDGGNGDACFLVKDIDNLEWKLCAKTLEIRTKWVCEIQKVLGINQDEICKIGKKKEAEKNVITKNIIQPVIIIPIPSPQCNENWNYQHLGRDWNCDCNEGKEQSPIDLPTIEKALDSPIRPMFEYEEVIVKSTLNTIEGQMRENQNLKLELVNGALKIFHSNLGKIITLDGAIYHAQEINIHTPAEHKIDGKRYDMEVQIIHYGQTKGDIAKQVILSFLFEKRAGLYNKFIDDLDIFNLPNPLTKSVDLLNNLYIPKILYAADDQEIPMMKPFSFFTYQGSISFPPCTEKTIIYVASKPLYIGTTALQLFQEALRVPDIINGRGDVVVSNWIPNSSRHVQPLNGRPVFHYNHQKYCGPDPLRVPPKPVGHYEKIEKSHVNYFYVHDSEPSGLPGAFVVSEREALGKPVKLL
jgi:carbonic anhydrase